MPTTQRAPLPELKDDLFRKGTEKNNALMASADGDVYAAIDSVLDARGVFMIVAGIAFVVTASISLNLVLWPGLVALLLGLLFAI